MFEITGFVVRDIVPPALQEDADRFEGQSAAGASSHRLVELGARWYMIVVIPSGSPAPVAVAQFLDVRRHPDIMRIPHVVIGGVLISVFATACSTDSSKQHHRAVSSRQTTDESTLKARLDQVVKEYDLDVQGHMIFIMLPDISSTGGDKTLMKENMETIQKITDAVHKALGEDSTNYVIQYMIE